MEGVLRSKGIVPGDYIEVTSSDGRVVRGVLKRMAGLVAGHADGGQRVGTVDGRREPERL